MKSSSSSVSNAKAKAAAAKKQKVSQPPPPGDILPRHQPPGTTEDKAVVGNQTDEQVDLAQSEQVKNVNDTRNTNNKPASSTTSTSSNLKLLVDPGKLHVRQWHPLRPEKSDNPNDWFASRHQPSDF
eukprot:GSA120T00020079001.1